MTEADAILTRILADTHAIFLPCRNPLSPQWVNAYHARTAYQKDGVGWSSEVATERDRKIAQRSLEQLVAARFVIVGKPKKVKTLGVRLSVGAMALTRALCGLPGMSAGLATLEEIAKYTKPAPDVFQDAWLPETKLAGVDWADTDQVEARRELMLVENLALPALVAGWIAAGVTVQGHVYYGIKPAGWRQLESGNKPQAINRDPDPEAQGLYADRLGKALAHLEMSSQDAGRDIGPSPLPVANQDLPAADWLHGLRDQGPA